ncbi:MAG: SDR family oxidoreductase [candidate division KSB1 bacterium]|nr:SDR family oxidoreductase [candidate division KSB1 bacterium]MDZ7275282.1 SDR family oxidoreductase [candidate division KSB1 bacterium]MDZ7287450.1 SDR family oxidoreductase [candidate division KSB1 bacterium]MDZ7299564.1 SDR family oxidoreductase [candidate division KSB1 bacterium]MDZ7308022.1 SDR family oxidoreductase [candidate division KSB1 bacterium]
MNFENRLVLITGGTGALGTSVSMAFLRAGGCVAVSYRRPEEFEKLKAAAGASAGRLHGFPANLVEETSVSAMVQQVAMLGPVQVLVNLVGGYFGGVGIHEMTLDQWHKIIDLNLKSVFLCCKHVLPLLQRQRTGRIINVSSQGGQHGSAGLSAYGAAKAGLINLTQTLSAEGRPYRITANVVVPGIIDTPANRQAMPNADFSRWVAPETVAHAILFLASEEAHAITGATLPVVS